ncbi:MAG TPA: hypothetical protein VLM42_01045 [Bryobacteraceae bacterium]|nr:hypothetical protein [Bryobacteraceae bacterium]
MNRRIVLLNLALLALVGALGWVLRANWLEAQARERAVLRRQVAPKAVLAPPSLPPVPAAAPAEYIDVANKMLFSKDRNPIVVVEPPKPAPEPVMPALPSYSGQMSIGEPVIFLSVAKDVQHSYHAGDQVGDFKLASFDQDNIVLEWNGKTVERKLEDLRAKQILAQAGAGAGASAGSGAAQAAVPATPRPSIPTPGFPMPTKSPDNANTGLSAVAAPAASSTSSSTASPAPVSPTTSLGGSKAGDGNSASDASDDGMFGAALPGGFRACVPADTSPAGTVHSGYRKVQSMSIFGASCDWEPVK